MNVHVITPLGRPQNYAKLAGMILGQGVSSWIILLDQHQRMVLPTFGGKCKFQSYEVAGGGHRGAMLMNVALKEYNFISDDWYCWLCDDDWLPPNFIETLRANAAEDAALIICSLQRGDQIPVKASQVGHPGHPCWSLLASPQGLCYGGISFEQGIMRGNAIREFRKSNVIDPMDPNEKALIAMAKSFRTQYISELFIWFNYLEPGRWNSHDDNPR